MPVNLSQMLKRRIKVLSENGFDTAPDAIKHLLSVILVGQTIIESSHGFMNPQPCEKFLVFRRFVR